MLNYSYIDSIFVSSLSALSWDINPLYNEDKDESSDCHPSVHSTYLAAMSDINVTASSGLIEGKPYKLEFKELLPNI